MLGGDALPDEAEVERDRYTGNRIEVMEMAWDSLPQPVVPQPAGPSAPPPSTPESREREARAREDAQRSNPETLASVDSMATWSDSLHLPLGGNVSGPSVLKLQILLDRAHFSPGEIDGLWGDNTEGALAWFQRREGVGETPGIADSATVRVLSERAGNPGQLVVEHTLTEDEVAGPFEPLPDDIYEKAKLDRLGYESLGEALGERFHVKPALLARLNKGVNLDSLQAGDTIRVPDVDNSPAISGTVATIRISGRGHYLQGVDESGRVLFHAPATLGAEYDPSPSGDFEVTAIAPNPNWYYQPKILENVPDDQESAMIPPGPNNAVGTMWIDLSEPHYGIHGTRAPNTIGYATSSGCTRLTNWDAEKLAELVRTGTPVQFRDIAGRDEPSASPASGG